ncbi:MAG: ATP-dependent DNA helicase RecQ [Cytophagaceae bacterium]|nr:ATP-dependent DNA helicase RecQ [Cytophagaceae bacterium]MBK9932932.1 ATP-dependent DNA helicase RecQ [Cytophagaceae bacterium]MBL0303357.1 ATP-dependent DNA helicase RecQ [Cytophagaceae bacterium]MBL0326206.1 ATP-dependent DNA helicase RecQ [Cytophagaceae bacterium]
MINASIEKELKKNLKEIFGFDNFRGEQEKIITSIVSGKNTFVIMPTGAGKSLCYQLPATVLEGTAIVISPLIALMKNQVDQLMAFGINAQFLNSTLNKSEMNRVKNDVTNGVCKLLYIAPESLNKEDNLAFLKKAKISFVAVDEAHCISEWGHDFRPEYRKIREIIENIDESLPIIALTATATPKVQLDIMKSLDMDNSELFKTSFNRANLYYEVRPKQNAKKQLIKFLNQHKGKSGIVYCLSRKKVEEIAELLVVNGYKALPYHAGLDSDVRMRNQDAFLNEDCDIVVATIAFGMGIDKPDVRFVVHYDAPKSLEGYYQETGRGGRDGLDGTCLMFYALDDITKLEKFNKDKNVTERDNAKALLMEMVAYSSLGVCRRRQLLSYFGEQTEKDCGFCDNCNKPTKTFKGEEEVKLVIKTILKTEQRFSANHIADVLTGNTKDNPAIASYGHDKLPEFGTGLKYFNLLDKFEEEEEEDEDEIVVNRKPKADINADGKISASDKWVSIIRQLMVFGYLEKDIENYGVVRVSEKGHSYLSDPYSITFHEDHDLNETEGSGEDELVQTAGPSGGSGAADQALLELLKALRKKMAKEKNVPPYVVFQDPSLEEMATTYPSNVQELAQVNGVGMGKVQKFGKPFLDLINKYVDDNEIETSSDLMVKTTVNKSKTKIFIIQQIDRKIDLEEIAEAKEMNGEELITEIESICFSGTKLNLDYYINQMIDRDKQNDIYEYFMNSSSDDIKTAMKEFDDYDDEVTEEELRLMRIKFISEMAN